jgi:hypothetical protein
VEVVVAVVLVLKLASTGVVMSKLCLILFRRLGFGVVSCRTVRSGFDGVVGVEVENVDLVRDGSMVVYRGFDGMLMLTRLFFEGRVVLVVNSFSSLVLYLKFVRQGWRHYSHLRPVFETAEEVVALGMMVEW